MEMRDCRRCRFGSIENAPECEDCDRSFSGFKPERMIDFRGKDSRHAERIAQCPDGCMTYEDAAADIGLTQASFENLFHAQGLKAVKVGRYAYVRLSDVDALKNREKQKTGRKPKRKPAPKPFIPRTETKAANPDQESYVDDAFLDVWMPVSEAARRLKWTRAKVEYRLDVHKHYGGLYVLRSVVAEQANRQLDTATRMRTGFWRPECFGCHRRRVVSENKIDCPHFIKPLDASVDIYGDCIWFAVPAGERPREAIDLGEPRIVEGRCSRCHEEAKEVDGRCSNCGVRLGQ